MVSAPKAARAEAEKRYNTMNLPGVWKVRIEYQIIRYAYNGALVPKAVRSINPLEADISRPFSCSCRIGHPKAAVLTLSRRYTLHGLRFPDAQQGNITLAACLSVPLSMT